MFCLNCGKELIKEQKKYCSNKCQREHQAQLKVDAWKKGEFNGMSGKYGISKYVRDYMLKKANFACELCGWNQINPITLKSPLEIHHKDGNYLNNTEENLQVLCPNCHSLTSTYKALNKSSNQEKRDRSEASHRKKYYCIDCGKEISFNAKRCHSCEAKTRITDKPVSREELKNLIRNKPFVEIGYMFSVSDNAIRKWCDFYNLPRKKTEIKSITDKDWELI